MATHWSSQNVVAEHKDVPATAMAVDCTGAYAVLAGRRLLALVNLDDPIKVLRRSTRGGHSNSSSKYDVKVLEWSPTKELHNYIALAAGNDCEVHTLDESGRLVHKDLLHAHTRAISDLNWHSSEAHLLATASVESCLYLWDVREPRRPMSMLPATSGATQVKWNRKNSHLLASGHDTDLRIWDSRKPDQPMQYLAGHMAKVNSIDWSSHHEAQIVSASLDCCLRFFDITSPRRPHTVITTKHPVWRAKYTPFGRGVVSNLVPQLVRGDNSLLLWAQDQPQSPMHSFVGHTDAVINFDWRTNLNGNNECQLVSWGRDRSLRIWKLDPDMQSLCGENFDESIALTAGVQESRSAQLLASRDGSRDPSPGLIPVATIKQEAPDELEGSECGSSATTTILGDGSAGTEGSLLTAIKTEPLIDQFLEPRLDAQTSDVVGIARGTFGSTSALVTASGSAGGEGAPHALLNATKSPTLSSSVPHESSFGMPASAGTGEAASRRMLLKDELSALQSEPWCTNSSLSVDVTCDASQRQVRVVVYAATHTVGLTINIHRGYPNSKRLQFSLLPCTTLDTFDKMQITSSLNSVAQESARKEHNCLIALVSTLIIRFSALHKLSSGAIVSATGALSGLQDIGDEGVQVQEQNSYGSDKDHSVPFPRTSGARFCGNGILVCFTRPTFLSQKTKNKTSVHQTPRSLSALGAYIGNFKPDLSPVPKPYDSMRGILKPYNMISKAPKNVRQYANSPAAPSSKKVTTMSSQKLRQSLTSGPGSSPAGVDARQRKRSLQTFHNRTSISGNMEPSERGMMNSAHHSRTAPVYGNGTLPSTLDGGERVTDYNLADVSISKYYYQQRSCRKWRLTRSVKVGEVIVYRTDALLPVDRALAQRYRLKSEDVSGSCTHNRLVTQRRGRRDLVQVWSLATRIVELLPTQEWSGSGLCKGLDPPWSAHPLASGLASKLLQHYASKGDVQTSAMLSCVFDARQRQDADSQHQQPSQQLQQQQQHASRRSHPQPSPQHQLLQRLRGKAGGSPYNTIHGLKAEPPPEPCTLLVRHNRSSSEGSIAEVARPDHTTSSPHHDSPSARHITSLLTSEMNDKCEECKRAYSNVLYNWNLLERRTEMQQYSSSRGAAGAAEPEFVCECGECGVALNSHYCTVCRRPAILCTVCQLPVRGQSLLCSWCGHGGHTTHLLQWFSASAVCASGCGCKCVSYFSQQLCPS